MRIILITAVTLLAAATGMAAFARHWQEKSKVAGCIINLRNYNSGIAGAICTSNEPAEKWSDPEAVMEFIHDKFEMDLPTCPDGGAYSLIYDQDSPYLPRLVCSKEATLGHKVLHN